MTLNSWSHSLLPPRAGIRAQATTPGLFLFFLWRHWRHSIEAKHRTYLMQPSLECSSPNIHIPGAGFQHTHLGHSNIHSMLQSWPKASWPKGLRKTGKVQAGELTWLINLRTLKTQEALGKRIRTLAFIGSLPLWHCRGTDLQMEFSIPKVSLAIKAPALLHHESSLYSPWETGTLSWLKAICFWGGWLNLSFMSTSPPSIPG